MVCWVGALVREAASALLNGPRTAGRALPHSTLMFLRADRVCCGGYTASASRSGGGALDDVKRSTRPCWTGSLVSPCAILSRRVFFWWLAAWFGFALRYDTWAAGSPLEERVYSRCGAGRSRRRARGDGVCSCGAGSPSSVFVVALVAGSLLSLEGGSDGVIFPRSVARSTACV